MGRGRKPISNITSSDWESVFYNSVGHFVQIINNELSKEYKLEPLSNHIKIIGGYAFKNAQYKKNGVPIIRISDFNDERIVLNDVVYYSEADELEKYELYGNDIIIALTGGTIAKLAIVQSGLGKLYLNQRVGKFKILKPTEFESEYVYWIARSVQSIIKNLAWGAAIPNVSPKEIEALMFAFPDKSIQKGIIQFLNDLKNNNIEDDKVYFNWEIEKAIINLQFKQANNNTLSTELIYQLNLITKLRLQLLQDAAQGKLVKQHPDDESASILFEKIKAEKEQFVKNKKLKKERELPEIIREEIPFDIPKNWVWCKLGQILLEIKYGTSQSCDYDINQNTAVLRIPNVSNGIIDIKDLKYTNLSKKEKTDLSLKENDILIIRSNGSRDIVGKTALVDKRFVDYAFAGYLIRLRFNDQLIDPRYLLFITQSSYFRKLIESPLRTTVGINNINTAEISNLLIPLPPIAEQYRIVQKLNQLMQTREDLETSIKQSKQQNEQLLQQVLREALTTEVEPEEVI
jgi:type I restriction enzyme S subunit